MDMHGYDSHQQGREHDLPRCLQRRPMLRGVPPGCFCGAPWASQGRAPEAAEAPSGALPLPPSREPVTSCVSYVMKAEHCQGSVDGHRDSSSQSPPSFFIWSSIHAPRASNRSNRSPKCDRAWLILFGRLGWTSLSVRIPRLSLPKPGLPGPSLGIPSLRLPKPGLCEPKPWDPKASASQSLGCQGQ